MQNKGYNTTYFSNKHVSKKTVDILLDNGADAAIEDMQGWGPWHYALVKSFNSTLVDKMLKAYEKNSDGKPWVK